MDSGINIDHQEFADWSGGGKRASLGWNFIENNDEPLDCDGHGTHTASTVVGRSTGASLVLESDSARHEAL